jgi:hypothetical protein
LRSRDRLDGTGEDARGPIQPVVLAQRSARVFVAEQPALTQGRHHLLGKHVEAARQPGRHDVEAVGRTILEPRLDIVRDFFRRAGNYPMAPRARQALHALSDRRLLAIDDVDDELETAGHAARAASVDLVSLVVRRVLGQPEILSGLGRARRDDVPARAPWLR